MPAAHLLTQAHEVAGYYDGTQNMQAGMRGRRSVIDH